MTLVLTRMLVGLLVLLAITGAVLLAGRIMDRFFDLTNKDDPRSVVLTVRLVCGGALCLLLLAAYLIGWGTLG